MIIDLKFTRKIIIDFKFNPKKQSVSHFKFFNLIRIQRSIFHVLLSVLSVIDQDLSRFLKYVSDSCKENNDSFRKNCCNLAKIAVYFSIGQI